MEYRLLQAFESLFKGHAYLHRKSNLGDFVAMHLYEDLYTVRRSKKLIERVDTDISVLNTQNLRRGISARRGDGSFGEVIPNTETVKDEGYIVSRGHIATIEIGVEVKILMKAMIKQIDRVISDLKGQAVHFKSRSGNPICVGIVGVNYAPYCVSYEGDRNYKTDGKKFIHPISEANEAEKRLIQLADPHFDEFLILRFSAINEAPFSFSWVNEAETALTYGAILARINQAYETRF